MSFIPSASALTCALVHPSARHADVERARHQTFITGKLGFSAVALGTAPFFLVYHGAPTPSEAAIFGLTLVPIVAAMIVVRTGRLVTGHVVAACGFAAIAVAVGLADGLAAAAAWLILAQLEAASSFDGRLHRVAQVALPAVLLILAILGAEGEVVSGRHSVLMATLAMLATVPLMKRIVGLFERASADVERERARSRAVAEMLGEIVIGFDDDGLVDHASSACRDLLGVPCGELAGRGLFERVHVADRPAFLKLVSDAAHGAGVRSGELRMRSATVHINAAGHPVPNHLWVEMRTVRLDWASGMAAGVVAVLRDITALRQQTAEVELAKQSVDDDARSRDEFLATMSHELRTPLNAIIGFSEMLGSHTLRPMEPEKQREYARIIHQSGQHLLSVVNSILDMSKIQSGTIAIIPEPFEISSLIEQCCDMIHLKAEEGRVEIVRDVPAGLDEIIGDRRACKQILINLLSNAVKFTPELGRVTVRARPEGTALRITVTDTGIGIGDADVPRLGDPFFQARGSFYRPYEGTGLGLSVVRGLIGLHGGSLALESELGKGTTVTVHLPFDCRTTPDKGASAAIIDAATRRSIPEPSRARDTARVPDPLTFSQPRMKQIA